MRVASILCKDLSLAKTQITNALPFCDVIELRLDYLEKIDITAIQLLRQEISLPVIFTLRKKSQGGKCNMPEQQRLSVLRQLAGLGPDYIDLEYDTSAEFIAALRMEFPAIQLMGSYHDFSRTADNLEQLFYTLNQPYFDIFKIATFANNLCDTLRLLVFLRKLTAQHRLVGMAMGEYGQASRILAPVVGSLFTYGSVDEASAAAPGQLTLRAMTEIYRVHLLNRDTAIYALLGCPIAQSPGHLYHNQAFFGQHKNAVYVKLKLNPELLTDAIPLFKQLPFMGFSVTIPHKETMVACIEEVHKDAQKIGAVNTIKRQGEVYRGYNTDSEAGAEVLAEKIALTNKQILILGAGGSAKALAHALMAHGAKVTLCNRTLKRAQTFIYPYGGQAIDFVTLFALPQLSFDVIVNTLPADAFAVQCADWNIPLTTNANCVAMDIVLKPLHSLFLQRAKVAGYACISGDALFAKQALRQQQIWSDNESS